MQAALAQGRGCEVRDLAVVRPPHRVHVPLLLLLPLLLVLILLVSAIRIALTVFVSKILCSCPDTAPLSLRVDDVLQLDFVVRPL